MKTSAAIYTPLQEAEILSRVARTNPDAVLLVAKMIGAGPCSRCNFISRHCRCKVKVG